MILIACRVLAVWRLPCIWVSGPVRVPASLPALAMPSPAAVAGRPRAAILKGQVYEITDARPSRAIERGK